MIDKLYRMRYNIRVGCVVGVQSGALHSGRRAIGARGAAAIKSRHSILCLDRIGQVRKMRGFLTISGAFLLAIGAYEMAPF